MTLHEFLVSKVGASDNVDDAFNRMKSSQCMTAVLEVLCEEVWNEAIERAQQEMVDGESQSYLEEKLERLKVQR